MTADSTAAFHLPATGTYRVDPEQSVVSYSGRHMFGLGTVHATFTVRSGELRVTDPATASTVAVDIDAASFHSNSAKRDKDVTGRSLLDVETFPDITFVSDGVREGAARWLVSGCVTAHGRTVPVEVVVDDVHPEGDGMRLHAHADRLDRHAFGITGSKGMVGRYLDLHMDVFASKA
jgi:polyisoprenoid-binding protein YceI